MENQPRNPADELSATELRHFLISHLNRIYCAKSQLIEKLPQLVKRTYRPELQTAIDETIDMVSQQLAKLKDVYILLGAFYQRESCIGLIGILDEAFQSMGAPGDRPALRDLSVLFYMQNIESIEVASFKTMMRVAHRLQQPDVEELLTECYDEAREDKVLFRELTETYL